MSNWTIDNIPSQKGKIVLITGANSGTGFGASKALAKKGSKVIMAVRNLEKGKVAAVKIKNEIPNADIELIELDLADLNSVDQFSVKFINKYPQLDILINNAGIAIPNGRTETKQGFESHFGTNHLGHFALTGKLLSLLSITKNSRVVTVGSFVPKQSKSKIRWEDWQYKFDFDGMKAYGQSKLANIMFALELQEKLSASNSSTISVLANPGFTKSGMQKDMNFVAKLMTLFFSQSVDMGILSILRAATDENVRGGEFYGPLHMKEMRGYPELTQAPQEAMIDSEREKLWKLSEQLTNTAYDFPNQ